MDPERSFYLSAFGIHRPIVGLISTIVFIGLIAGGLWYGSSCDQTYRPCADTCSRLSRDCGAERAGCIDACDQLDGAEFISFTECVWQTRSEACDAMRNCWPLEGRDHTNGR